jgi:hypothetical protein
MKGWLMLVLWMMTMLSLPADADADVDESTYVAGGAVRDDRQRQRLQTQFAKEAEAERRRTEAAAEAAARAQAAAAARPYPVRLLEQRCTPCHAATDYAERRHTWLYWRLLVARMVWLNEAVIPAEEQGVIAGHLAATQPAGRMERLIEYGGPAGIIALLAALIWSGRRLWQRHRQQPRGGSNADAGK